MAGERIPKKKVLNGKLRNTKPMGKPSTRQEDVVRRDTSQNLGIRGWRRREKTERNGGVVCGRPGPKKGCSAIDGWLDGWMEFDAM